MHCIKSTQTKFYESIFNNSKNPEFIRSFYPVERLDIYRQTILENLRHALSITFPGTWNLLGDPCANSVAYSFSKSKKNLPISGCLDDWGNHFPEFLNNQKELKELPYIQDFAIYEWLVHKSYGSEQCSPINHTTLEFIPQDQIDSIGFSFLPSVFMFNSPYPIHDIQEIAMNHESSPIQLSDGKVHYAIISRPGNDVITSWISGDLWHFFDFLKKGANIKQAFSFTLEKHPNFDLTNAIYFIFQRQLVDKIILPEETL